ncbi:c-type cytochrome [Henriciella aquimarina]|uniref:c-type cytochrome n=1 Tax=Henriciella aquimarina TaxID=545261 RepID=UPI001301B19C|nr:c-type cytochrome [Henriciella aquimarina]
MDDFYAARTANTTALPWSNFAPPFSDVTTWDPEHGQMTTGVDTTGNVESSDRPEEATAALLAWDPVKQERVWRVQADRMVPAGVMATGGGLVFQGAVDGYFSAYDAATGEEVWSYDMKAPAVIAPVTYAVDGKQYVTILTGTSGVPSAWGHMVQSLGLDYRSMDRRVLTFALDGEATLPPRTVVDLQKPEDPDYEPNPELEQLGAKQYAGMCSVCHGYNAVSGGRAPDLRYSSMIVNPETFNAVVREGALLPAGMPKFAALSDNDLNALRQYIRAQAKDPELDEEKNITGMSIVR